jgi:hypothetical protein
MIWAKVSDTEWRSGTYRIRQTPDVEKATFHGTHYSLYDGGRYVCSALNIQHCYDVAEREINDLL